MRLFARLAAGLVAAFPLAAAAQSPPPIWASWIAALRMQGYAVSQGDSFEYTSAYCTNTEYPLFHSCFGFTATDPYIVMRPPVGAEYVDPYYGSTAVAPSGQTVSQDYRLSTTEAILVIVNLPPPGAYFSYQSYLFTRPVSAYPHGVSMFSPDPTRGIVYASFNNSINNVQIKRQSGLDFGQGTIGLITTPNATLAATLTASFAANGGNPTLLFNDPIGPNINPGLGAGADEFLGAIRYSVPEVETDGDAWRTSSVSNVLVYRIDAPSSVGVSAYATPVIASKTSNVNEASHAATLNELTGLLANWLTPVNGHGTKVSMTTTSEKLNKTGVVQSGQFGPYCIIQGTDCYGDEQDNDAYKLANVGQVPNGAIVIIDGVNHAVTNNATFMSLATQDIKLGARVAVSAQTNPAATGFADGPVTGSALAVLQDLNLLQMASPALMADLPNLYVQFFARTCPPQNIWCTRGYTSLIDPSSALTEALQIVERAYVLPGYLNGANPNALLNPQVLH